MDLARLLERSGRSFYLAGLVLVGYTAGANLQSGIMSSVLDWQLDRRLESSAQGGEAFSSPDPGSVLGRLEIPRLDLATPILEGTEASSLQYGVGHIAGTAFPGSPGNVGLAGHRDRCFRQLKDARIGDRIEIATPDGLFHYRIASLSVVRPHQTEVLAGSEESKLTLITCYPFNYLGRAPRRLVVEARALPPMSQPRRPQSPRTVVAVARESPVPASFRRPMW
jgi:sortase A